MRLRLKILSGFLILAFMLSIAGIWSIYELQSIGTSVQQLLEDNYKSIDASKIMLEALEREDSGILLLLSGKWHLLMRYPSFVNNADRRHYKYWSHL